MITFVLYFASLVDWAIFYLGFILMITFCTVLVTAC